MVTCRFWMGNSLAFQCMDEVAKSKGGFMILDQARYTIILKCICGFSVEGRQIYELDESDTWLKRGVLLSNLHKIEELIFERSVKTLLNKENGSLVIDDELISSCAKDVESKTLSNRKAGKEGPVSDCIACSVTNVLFGLRLRVSGVNQTTNVNNLLWTLPKITSAKHHVRLTFDRGYGKLPFVENSTKKSMMYAPLPTHLGLAIHSYHLKNLKII